MFIVTEKTFERVLMYEDFPVLSVKLAYPEVTGLKKRANRRISAYYERLRRVITSDAANFMLPAAIEDFARQQERGKPFREHRVRLTYTAAPQNDDADDNSDEKLAVTRTLYLRQGGEEGDEREYAETWDTDGWFAGKKAVRRPKKARVAK
ncbi:MAG: hypothetical protein LBN02_03865 [Oscillospiraceae bacterium]|jgi:hypothetical protein|nr:hypothetical protein [Oscillospiraceae bacterium]